MKESTEIISEIIFTRFPSHGLKRSQAKQIFCTLKKHAISRQKQFFNGVATLGIGAVLLLSIYLFLIQLAEYGWH